MMQKQNPSLYLTVMTKSARKDRIYIDYLRNERGATAVAAFSPPSPPRHAGLDAPWPGPSSSNPTALPSP